MLWTSLPSVAPASGKLYAIYPEYCNEPPKLLVSNSIKKLPPVAEETVMVCSSWIAVECIATI